MGQSPLVPFESQPPDRSQPGSLAPYTAPATAPLHAPGTMSLESGGLLRDACWNRLSPGVRAKLAERTGPVIEWWATTTADEIYDGRPKAVVLGHHGLAIAEPRIDADHRPVQAVATYVLDPASFRRQWVEHRPRHGSGTTNRISPPPAARAITGLAGAHSELLGNLPPEAQTLLQSPFLDGSGVQRCDWHYQGSANHLGMFMIYLAGKRALTAAMGTKTVPAGHTDATAHWSLMCLRATVTRRIGT